MSLAWIQELPLCLQGDSKIAIHTAENDVVRRVEIQNKYDLLI